ncbi:hypothetical protein [Leucothrix mucor]|uniref:hypothetical protein n=1 Tax=Leucothrix mucor TaxID=45248 RepID=UPI0012F9B037|nr:hypothetical protein [Leucothrix mucor]
MDEKTEIMLSIIRKIMTTMSLVPYFNYAGHNSNYPTLRLKHKSTKSPSNAAKLTPELSFLANIERTSNMSKPHITDRWKTVSVNFTNDDFVCIGLFRAFNDSHADAKILDIYWNNKHAARYRCTQEICTVYNIERLIDDTALSPEKASASFRGISIEKGTKMLWSNLHFAGIEIDKIACLETVEDACSYFPLRGDITIYTDPEVRVAYLDWVLAVTRDFNQLIKYSRASA